MRFPPFAALALLPALLAGPVAEAANLHVEYRLTLAGLSIGMAGLDGAFDGDRYRMSVQAQLTGIAGALSGGGRGGGTAVGVVAPNRLNPTGFSATGQSSSTTRTLQIGIASGNVTRIDIDPPFEERPDRVPLTQTDTRNITDPLSGLIAVAAKSRNPVEAANCNRTVPVFDGTQRFDLTLSYAETTTVRKPGYDGPVLVCDIRYTPIAGHRPSRPMVQFMTDNRDMSVWLAPVEGTRVLVPIRISVRTPLGTNVIEAEKWTLSEGGKAAGE